MVGLVVKHGEHVVVVTAEDALTAQAIAVELFASEGIDLDGCELTMVTFDPDETGGVILTTEAPPDMTGWGPDGFTAQT